MKFRRQLARLKAEHAGHLYSAPLNQMADSASRTASMKQMMGEMARRYEANESRRVKRAPPRAATLPGENLDTEYGLARVIDECFSLSFRHGRYAVGKGNSLSGGILSALTLDDSFKGVDERPALFLDTETTGLSIGGSTLAALIGWSWFEGPDLNLRQTLLTCFGEERPMLSLLRERLEASAYLVTYNGKSFDWPLLVNRFVMNRMPPPPVLPHFDLLHVARRIFKKRLLRTRLIDIEREILGKHRIDDIDGAEIPEVFMHLITSGEPGRVPEILRHNRDDLLALPALLGLLGRMVSDVDAVEDQRDLMPLAKLALRGGAPKRAEVCAQAAIDAKPRGQIPYEGLLLLASQARKDGAHQKEETHLLDALTRAACGEAHQAHLRLAILYEHRLVDFSKALHHAHQSASAEGQDAASHRIARLKRRRARQRARGECP